MDLAKVLDQLYASEINIIISCFWDGGWNVGLGDCANGFRSMVNLDHAADIAPWLHAQALKWYPESDYALLSHPA